MYRSKKPVTISVIDNSVRIYYKAEYRIVDSKDLLFKPTDGNYFITITPNSKGKYILLKDWLGDILFYSDQNYLFTCCYYVFIRLFGEELLDKLSSSEGLQVKINFSKEKLHES